MNALKAKKPVYQLRLKISCSISAIEEWMEDNCEGSYSVFNQLELLFAFDLKDDRDNFKEAVMYGTF